MLKRLYQSLFPSNNSPEPGYGQQSATPHVIPRSEHNVSRKNISENALTVIYQLRRSGYDGYLVGGCIRDLLLDKKPKDFDIATNATPEQVKQLFRRARIVGRRFKIAHVRFGREIIEVTTFRADHQPANPDTVKTNKQAQTNDQGMLLRDNVYGSLREDALRRDFTVNALYYDIDGFKILDHVNGVKDLQNKVLRIIGDPTRRYSEDPVRMLRAIRFKAKLNFDFDAETAKPLANLGHLLEQVAPPRLFDEVIKLFLTGYGRSTFELLVTHELFAPLFPAVEPLIRTDKYAPHYQLICQALDNTDQRVREGKTVTPAFIYAALLWPVTCQQAHQHESEGQPRLRALQMAGHYAIDSQLPSTAIPRRFSIAIREIWALQQRLENTKGKRAIAVMQSTRFRAAYDFLLLRELSGESLGQRGQYWTQLQLDYPLDTHAKDPQTTRPPAKRRRRRSSSRQRHNDSNEHNPPIAD